MSDTFKRTVGLRFRPQGKTYIFEAGDLQLQKKDQVIVQTDNGPAIGVVITVVREVEASRLPNNLKAVDRLATEDDLQRKEANQQLERDAFAFCRERIALRRMPMKLIDVESMLDTSKMIFFFTADHRVDFRDLVRDLVQKYRTRIELRQINARQETRMIKGLGICGREVCCSCLLPTIDRVSIRMAKEQGISLNPEKISGLCGRLMCCLAFEYDGYCEMKQGMPKCGKTITIAEGCAKVIRQNVLRGEIALLMENGKEIIKKIKDL